MARAMGAATATRRRRTAEPAATEPLPDTLKGVETFAAGEYPGDQPGEVWAYTDGDVKQIVHNFALLSKGETPLHRVPVVVTHDKAHAYAWVQDAAKANGILTTDWERVEPSLARRIRAGRLVKVSPEIKRDFTDKDGKVYPGPYLYRIAVLGADVPRVKGLADLPESFADRTPGRRLQRALRFADQSPRVSTMTREQAIQFLTQMGIDPAVMGADVPDAFLIAVAQAWQDEDDLDTGDGNGDTNPNPAVRTKTAMADPNAGRQPSKVSVTQTYADPKMLRKLIAHEVGKATAAATKTITDAAAAEAKAREARAALERQAAVRVFCDARKKEGKLSPADCDEGAPTSVISRLLRLAAQPPVTHTFADPKDKAKQIQKTELELQQEEIDARPARKFSERISQDGSQGEGAVSEHAKRTKEYWAKRGARNGATAGAK